METLVREKVKSQELENLNKEVIKKFTKEEKVRLLSGKGAWHTYDYNGKLPSIMIIDGPHGLRKQTDERVQSNNLSKVATCFPTASAIACSWNTEVVAKMAAAIGREAIAEKVSIVLGPGINIKRSPLCGRNFEYFSEDPFLSGTLSTAYIKSLQDIGVGASLKHFAGNSQETNRQTYNSQIDERALREIYLQAFEMAVKEAQPITVMAAYNRLNGEYACANKWLLTDILRNEWGFKGTIISDWGAVTDIVKCIKAGMDLEMPHSNGIHSKQILEGLNEGRITEEEINRAFSKVWGLISSQSEKIKDATVDYAEHHKIAKELECEAAVLLKNDGFLPLENEAKVIIVGEMAVHMRFQGGGSSHINTAKIADVVESFKGLGMQIDYSKGYHVENDIPDEKLEEEAVELAKSGLPILFFGGLTDNFEGEGYDRRTLEIPKSQTRLFNKLYEVNKNIAFIFFGGSAMKMNFAEKARSILHMYLGGQAVGEACADLITGKVNPSGKLAETFPISLQDVPSYKYFGRKSDDIEYRESIFVGYRYYDTYNKPVQFPFGHGLSYTSFEYSDIELSSKTFEGGRIGVKFKIKNTGTREGKEIAEVYVKNPKCNYLRAVKELRGFKKVKLKPGEQKEVTVYLTDRSFSIYDENKEDFIMPSGHYEILVAASVEDIRLKARVYVNGVEYNRDDRKRLQEYFEQDGKEFEISREQFERLYGHPLSRLDDTKKGEFTVYNSLEKLADNCLLGKIALKFALVTVSKMFKGKSKNDPEVMMFTAGIKEGTIESLVCQSEGMIPYKVAEAVVLSANGHHLKAIKKIIRG